MRRRKRPFTLLLSILTFIVLAFGVFNYPPSAQFAIFSFQFSVLPVFFLALFIATYSLFTFILANKRRGLLISLFTITYLILRLNGLTHPFFTVLLIILLGSLELFYVKRK